MTSATIRERERSDGTIAYAVLWREGNRQRSKTTDTRRQAEFVEAMVEHHGTWRDEFDREATAKTLTLAEWIDHYLEHLTGATDRSRHEYRKMLDRHIVPALGGLPLTGITSDMVRRWVLATSRKPADRRGKGESKPLSGKSLSNLHGLLSACLASAVEAGHLPSNPCRGVKLPRTDDHQREDMVLLSPQEYRTLLGCIDPHYRPLVALLAGTGLRWGEATALTIGDVDLLGDPPVVRVNKAVRRTPEGGYEIGPTKTKRSRRTVSLAPETIDELAALMVGERDETLMRNRRGNTIHNGTFHSKVWKKAVDEAGLGKRPRIHDLRHSHVSWLVAAGVPLPVIQARLGHESIKTTIDVYGHLLPDLHRQGADATQRALVGALG